MFTWFKREPTWSCFHKVFFKSSTKNTIKCPICYTQQRLLKIVFKLDYQLIQQPVNIVLTLSSETCLWPLEIVFLHSCLCLSLSAISKSFAQSTVLKSLIITTLSSLEIPCSCSYSQRHTCCRLLKLQSKSTVFGHTFLIIARTRHIYPS